MAELFEAALERKVAGDPRLQVLRDQWGHDKRALARALQAVSQWFPHYSLHDRSHADTVLQQIARLLGKERIERLSATDLWLMLEAAYLHDVGMVVTDHEARRFWSSQERRDFLARHQAEHTELARAAAILEGRDVEGEHWSFEVRRALILVMAEYVRSRHAERAASVVMDPELLRLASPRPPEIPERLFRALGEICAAHGRSFEQTMALSDEQSGVGADQAHPRFVACMLRLGDLLDLDSGRFCAVMLQTFGALPPTSEDHRRKHASIQDLNVTPSRIRVRARCDDYGAYEVTQSWLSWLERELSDQAARWAEIRPSEDFGELPREREITAELEGLLDLGKERPRFELDRAAILDLVRGANVYTQEMVFVRELVQNAIDATLLRAFEEHGSALADLAALRERMADYPIAVRFRRQGPGRPGPDDEPTVRWTVTVEDRGIGISRDDIRWILNVGSSRRNAARNAVIRRMPEWMRPSGVFGIGLQSVAMKASELSLRSRRWRTSQAHELRIRFGENPEDDEILAWPLDPDQAHALDGTVAEVTLEIPRVADHAPWGGSARLQALLAEHDPLVDDELPLDVHYGLDIASELAASSTARIEVWHEDHCVARTTPAGASPRWFDAEACVEVRRLEPRYGVFSWSYYRGARIERQRFWRTGEWNEFFGASLDFMFGTAQQVLSVSRERARESAWPQLRDRATLALLSVLPRWLEHLHEQGHAYLGLASVGAKLLLEEQPRKNLRYWHEAPVLERIARLRATVDQQGAWEEPRVLAHPDATLRVGELWRMPVLRLRLDHRGGSRQATWLLYHHGPEGPEGTWQEAHGWAGHVFLAGWSGKTYLRQVEPGIDEYAFTKGERHPWVVAQSGLDGLLWDLGARAHSSVPRYVIPLVEGFEALEISGYDGDQVDPDVPLQISWFLDHHHDFLRQHPMLCPFVGKGRSDGGTLQLPALDRVVEATVRWSAHGHTRAQVIEALGRFIRTAHELLEPIWGERIGYDPAAALAELEGL